MDFLEMQEELFRVLESHGAARCGAAELSDVPASALPPSKGAELRTGVAFLINFPPEIVRKLTRLRIWSTCGCIGRSMTC